jgi:hypothetical protein
MNARFRLTAINTANQTRLTSSAIAAGISSGITMNEISRNSKLMPSRNTMMCEAMMKPHRPPGTFSSQDVIRS